MKGKAWLAAVLLVLALWAIPDYETQAGPMLPDTSIAVGEE